MRGGIGEMAVSREQGAGCRELIKSGRIASAPDLGVGEGGGY